MIKPIKQNIVDSLVNPVDKPFFTGAGATPPPQPPANALTSADGEALTSADDTYLTYEG